MVRGLLMLAFGWMVCAWLPVLATASSEALPALPYESKQVTFLGFSHDGSVTAWRVVVRRTRADGSRASYALIKVVDTQSMRLVDSFHEVEVARHGTSAGPIDPAWQAARSASAWGAWRRRAHFESVKLDFKDSLVRLAADDDADVAVHADAAHKLLEVTGHAGRPLGFTPVTRLFEGETVPLGHYRVEASAGAPPHATLQVYHARDGRAVAVLVRFDGQHGAQGFVFVTPQDDPIGSTHIGTMPMAAAQNRSLQLGFEQRHPEAMRKLWGDVTKYF